MTSVAIKRKFTIIYLMPSCDGINYRWFSAIENFSKQEYPMTLTFYKNNVNTTKATNHSDKRFYYNPICIKYTFTWEIIHLNVRGGDINNIIHENDINAGSYYHWLYVYLLLYIINGSLKVCLFMYKYSVLYSYFWQWCDCERPNSWRACVWCIDIGDVNIDELKLLLYFSILKHSKILWLIANKHYIVYVLVKN